MERLEQLAAQAALQGQALGRAFDALPDPALVALALLPALLSLFTRSAFAIASSVLMTLAGVALLRLAEAPVGDYFGGSALLGALLAAFYGWHDRARRAETAALRSGLQSMRDQITVFCQALDQRSQIVDERASEAWKQLDALSRTMRAPPGRPDPQRLGPQPQAVGEDKK